jgi:RNA polymerase sigma factor (sigma-70 family)
MNSGGAAWCADCRSTPRPRMNETQHGPDPDENTADRLDGPQPRAGAAAGPQRLGDRAAFAALYERSSGHLFAVILRIQRDRDLAEDLLQEVYVNAWKAAGSFDAQRAQPLTWLTQHRPQPAIDSLRRAQAQPQTESLHADDDDDDRPSAAERLADDAPGPLRTAERASDARQLGAACRG